MTTPQEPLVLDAVLARNERASDTVNALCNGTERWVMRVPAQPDRDPDLVISASLSDVPALVTELTQARDEAAELRAAVQAFVDKYFQPGSKADRPDYSLMVTAADVFALREALRVRERATVARDDAAELKAQFHEWWSAYVNVASRLGMTSVDDAGRLGAVATAEELNAEITRRERNAAELRAAAEEALEAIKHQQRDPAYHSAYLLLQRAARRLRAALAASEGQP